MERIYTKVIQIKVRVLSPADWEGYERNKPGDDYELIESIDNKKEAGKPNRVWVTKRSLDIPELDPVAGDILTLFNKYASEVIGEDEKTGLPTTQAQEQRCWEKKQNNKLRAEQRERLAKLTKEESL